MDNTRQLQINSLLQNVTNITEKYNNIYEVLWFDPKINRTVCLSITLPPQFPTVAPVFRVTPQIFHPWVDSNGLVVGHKKLGSGWNQHVSVANVTNEILKELKTGNGNNSNSVSLAPQQSYPGLGMSNSLPRMSMSNNSYYYNNNNTSQQMPPPRIGSMMGPPYPGYQSLGRPNTMYNTNTTPMYHNANPNDVNISDLDNMSIDELKEILNNDSKRKEYINGKEKIKEMYKVKEEMSLNNKNLAEKTLAYKENFERLKSELKEQQDILRTEKEKFESLIAEQNQYVSNFTPDKLYSSLQNASSEADHESEEIANDFLMGTLSADEFLKKYRASRKLYHVRSEKVELFSSNQDSLFLKK